MAILRGVSFNLTRLHHYNDLDQSVEKYEKDPAGGHLRSSDLRVGTAVR